MRKTGVYGDKELSRLLDQLSRGLPPGQVDKSARQSMGPMLNTAKANARAVRYFPGKYPGFPDTDAPPHLDQELIVKRSVAKKGFRSYMLGATRRAAKIAHLVEFGTAPHWQPKFKGGFLHPGAKREPFLTEAYEGNADEVVSGFSQRLLQNLKDLVKKGGGRIR